MRILLAQNAPYYPSHGGGDKSNRLLMEALSVRGHVCRAVAQVPGLAVETAYERRGVEVRAVPAANLRLKFNHQVVEFQPDAILCSTDDPAQILLEAALAAPGARVVYLVRATLAVPFGPDCAFPSESKTARIRAADAVVGVSQYVADYVRRYAGIQAVHVPISLVEPEEWPELGRRDNEFVTMVNPCAVKGIDIFLALADAFPQTAFAAVPTWGTNQRDRAALAACGNVRLLDPVDDINLLLQRTRVMLVPSLWAEARSRMVLEAMLRGVPVMASDVGGIPEAKMGVPYLLPVNPIARYQPRVDEQMVPVAEVPPQDIGPWRAALERLLADGAHYGEIARASRAAALQYASTLSVEPFERLLAGLGNKVREPAPPERGPARETLSPEKSRLLALRLRQRAPASAWFPGADAGEGLRLFWFPHAGGWGGQVEALPHVTICPVRLPGRESRLAEAPFERMGPLTEALAAAIEAYLDRPFAFFGHSMGAVVAFELARALRRRSRPLPRVLIASTARAPQYRRNYVPPPPASDSQLIEEVRQLGGVPAEVLDDPAMMRVLLPALRADSALYRNYVYTEDMPLECPIRAYGGTEDAHVQRDHLEGWAQQTTGGFHLRLFPGGHFYLRGGREEFVAAVAADLG